MNHLEIKIKEKYSMEDISVLEYTTMKEPAKVKCNTCGSEYTLKNAYNFFRKSKNCICNKCNNNKSGGRLDLKDFQKKINEKYPSENLTVLNYIGSKNPCSIKCNCCEEIYTLQNAEKFLNNKKTRICKKCLPNKREQMQKSINRFKNWIQVQNDFIFEHIPEQIRSNTLIEGYCIKCGQKSSKTIYDYMKGKTCANCQQNRLKTKEQYQQEIGDEYEVLEYNGMNHRSKFQHKICGFIYDASSVGYNCPKCKGSKGEKKIRYWLLDNGITFEEQKTFIINEHKLRVDFYLPENDLVIEYQGAQHFMPIDYFGGEDKFKLQQAYDDYKRNYFKEKMIEISYIDYENIPNILNDLNLRSSSTIL